MYSYIIGKVVSINKKSITLENNGIGYNISVSNPNDFSINKISKIYLYKHISTNNKNCFIEEFYGFINYESKDFFINLIGINGIGVKTAIQICKNNVEVVKKLILNNDVNGLVSLKNITPKYARLMCEYLIQIYTIDKLPNKQMFSQIIMALKTLGYTGIDIDSAISYLACENNEKDELSDLISKAIKFLSVKKYDLQPVKTN